MLIQDVTETTRKEAHRLPKNDAAQIYALIKGQINNLTYPQWSLYEEMLDTQTLAFRGKSTSLCG